MKETLVHAYLVKPSPLAERYHHFCWKDNFDSNGLDFFRGYMTKVKELVPGENLLLYEVQDGWEPLCEFLGKQVPGVLFPHSDAWRSYKEAHGSMG